MLFNFNRPIILLVIPLLLAFSWLTFRRARLKTYRRNMILTLRGIVIILIVSSLAGTGIKKVSGTSTTVFAVDGSASIEKMEYDINGFIKNAIDTMDKKEEAGVIRFGFNSAVEVLPSANPLFSSLQSRINDSFTNIENGLKFAGSLVPASDRKRIVLVTDGRENTGDAVAQAKIMRRNGFIVDVFPLSEPVYRDVQVKDIEVPSNVHSKQTFEISVSIYSTHKTSAVLELFTNRQLSAVKEIELLEGLNKYAFIDSSKEGGMVTYSVSVKSGEDEIPQNNKMSTFTYVEDIPRILLVHDEYNDGEELIKILENDVKVDVNRPEAAPSGLEELQRYDAFILTNVSIEKLGEPFLENLEKVVRLQGKGLLVTGGDNSYGPGGYYQTILEDILPVNMDIKPKEEEPNLGLILVIDKSGSMGAGQYGISKVELAKEAAIRSCEILKDKDMIGVIAFDGAVKWVVKTQYATNKEAIVNAIGSIRADGGTQILPPLKEAYLSLKDADTKLKHIILLTDGQAEKTGYLELIDGIADAGISISTVAVGREADTELLAALAWGGNGRYYMTDEFADIPKIFAKETFLAGKTYFNNRIFTPSLKNYSEILAGIEAVPTLEGYVASTPKKTSTVIFESDMGDPLLSVWQYGLGRTAAWTSDIKGMWTSSWMLWEQSPRFWKNLVSYLLQDREVMKYSVEGSFAEGRGRVELKLPESDFFKGDVDAVLAGPEGPEFNMELQPVEPGLYRGEFDPGGSGVYVANISLHEDGESKEELSTGIRIPYSPEYDISEKNNTGFLEKIAAAGGGRIISSAADVFSGELEEVTAINDITDLLLIIAILLYLVEIAIRRLNIPFERFFGYAKTVSYNAGKYTKQVLDINFKRLEADKTKNVNLKNIENDSKKEKNKKVLNNIKKDEDSHISALLEKMKKRKH